VGAWGARTQPTARPRARLTRGAAGVAEAAVDALAALCRLEEGREACVLAGARPGVAPAVQRHVQRRLGAAWHPVQRRQRM